MNRFVGYWLLVSKQREAYDKNIRYTFPKSM